MNTDEMIKLRDNMRHLKRWISARMTEFDWILRFKEDLYGNIHTTAQLEKRIEVLERERIERNR